MVPVFILFFLVLKILLFRVPNLVLYIVVVVYKLISVMCFYVVGSEFFTLKVFYGGEFDSTFEHYNGGDVVYFDYICRIDMSLIGLKEMLEEIGLEKESFDVWLQLPGRELHSSSIMPLQNDGHVQMLGDLVEGYCTLLNIYTVTTFDGLDYDFSFTQYELDEREKRVEEIREECEKDHVEEEHEKKMEEQSRPGEDTEEEQLKYYCDTSNIDSTETEAPTPRRRRRIPPPNPPYRTRKRGRYSMLRVSAMSCIHCQFAICICFVLVSLCLVMNTHVLYFVFVLGSV